MDQLPPQNIMAEQELLAGIFYNPKILAKVVNELKTNDFYSSKHQHIYNAMCTLFANGQEIGITPIIEVLGKDKLTDVGGVTYLTELMTSGLKLNPKQYIEIIKDRSYRRKAVNILSNSLAEMYDEKNKPQEIVSKISTELTPSEIKSKILNDSNLFERTVKGIEERYSNGGEIPGMKTGYTDFDRATNGLKRGELFVIGGRPSMGKTLMGLNIADGLAKNKYTGLIFELEMSEEQIGIRRLAYNANINAQKLQTGNLEEKEFLKIAQSFSSLAEQNRIFTDCSSYQNILTIKAKSKAIKQVYGLDFIIVDHLTLLDIPNTGNRSTDIGEITRQLKLLAKELDINVMLICQLSRLVEQRPNKRPMMSDLRESGNIEQDADLIVFAYRDEYYNKETEDKNIMEWIIAKQRNGRTGTLKFCYLDKIQKIGNLDQRY
jgi:replicative DNA helicase